MTGIRRVAGLAAVVAGVAVAGHGAVWWWVTERMQHHVAAAIAAPPQPGWQAAAGPMRRGGWPLAAVVEVAAPALAAPLGPGRVLGGRAERLTLTIALARPRTLVAELSGALRLQLGAVPAMEGTAGVMRAHVPLDPSGDVPVTVEVEGLRATTPAGALSLARLDLALGGRSSAPRGAPALSVTLAARDLVLPGAETWPLGPALSRLGVEMVVTGPMAAGPDIAARAEAWRDGGGVLELRRLELAWGEVTLAGEAFLRLDPRLQPVGQGSARLGGHGAALRALTAAGIMAPRAALAGGAVLGLMARPPPGGGPPVVEAPLALRDGVVSLGPIPLARVPELVWRPPG
jgi:hypothetical protein